MHSKKTLFLSLILLFGMTFAVTAQMSLNPSHQFYEDALNWQVKGYVSKLPPVRPYPYSNIKTILEQVIENGNDSDKELAKEYYSELTGKPWHIELNTEVDTNNKQIMFRFHPAVDGEFSLLDDTFSMGYKLGWDARTQEDESTIKPLYSFPKYDSIQDPASVGPASIYLDSDTILNYGLDSFYVQAGLNRNGFGNFINSNLSLNEASYHSGNVVITYMNDFFTYSQLLSTIGASSNYDGSILAPNKYLALHLVEFNPIKGLSLGYYETIVFGNRFDPIYLIPAPYMACQGLNGCLDNLQMGLNVSYSFLNQFNVKADIFIDDIDFNRAVKFDFDSKNRIAAQLGFVYLPKKGVMDFLELDCTAITPHTYSHWEDLPNGTTPDENTINYQDYTNSGIKMGSQYDPNTVALSLKTSFTPIKNLKIKANFDFITHGNISESITDKEAFEYLCAKENVYSTDGSIFVDSKLNNQCMETPWSHLNFLDQEHLMYTVRPSIDVSYRIPRMFGFIDAKFGFSYTFEFIHNNGVNNHLFPGGLISDNGDGTISYNGAGSYDPNVENDVSTVVQMARENWANNLSDETKHMFSIYCTLTF